METLAIIVNYKSASLCVRAARSVLESPSMGPVQVVVVDNSEDEDEAAFLQSNLPAGVDLQVNPVNLGFGKACSWALDRWPGELILLMNPDARLLPGCLLRLQKTLGETQRAAAVSPRIFWDDGLRFLLPSSYPRETLEWISTFESLGPQAPANRVMSALWRQHSIRLWRAVRPVKVKNLSGALVLLKRSAVEKAGGLFDPRFFLYFEDTDLFVRLNKTGYTCLMEPRAEAIHHYDQCGQAETEKKRLSMAESHRLFLEKHGNGWNVKVREAIGRCTHVWARVGDPPVGPDFISPFVLKVPEPLQEEWLFEVSPHPTFIPSAGRFGRGPVMDFPREVWALLAPGQYFGRLGVPRFLGKTLPVVSWKVGGD